MSYNAQLIETLSFRDAIRTRISTLKFQSLSAYSSLIIRSKEESKWGIFIKLQTL